MAGDGVPGGVGDQGADPIPGGPVRLAANSVLRIVTLRDEGIAISVVEGTLSLRLAKFDRAHEYFEIDAPKTTLAA